MRIRSGLWRRRTMAVKRKPIARKVGGRGLAGGGADSSKRALADAAVLENCCEEGRTLSGEGRCVGCEEEKRKSLGGAEEGRWGARRHKKRVGGLSILCWAGRTKQNTEA